LLAATLAGFTSFVSSATSGYFQIATVTAAGGETSLTFSSIPATYTDLQIRGVYRDTQSAASQVAPVYLKFNASGTPNYAHHTLSGDGTNVAATGNSARPWVQIVNAGTTDFDTANAFGASIIDITDYASTTKNKTVKAFAGNEANTAATVYSVGFSSGVWLLTNAINSIQINAGNIAFKANSTFTLYGIKAFS
jgi:hypothetical protein